MLHTLGNIGLIAILAAMRRRSSFRGCQASPRGQQGNDINRLNNIGNNHICLGNYAESFRSFQKSLKVARDQNDRQMVGLVLGSIANIYHLQGNYRQSRDYFQQSLKIAEENGDKVRIHVALNNIGLGYFAQEDFPEALKYYEMSLKISEEVGDKHGIAETLGNMGSTRSIQGDHSQALEYFQKSLRISEQLSENPQIAAMLNNIGEVQWRRGNYQEAAEMASRAAAIAEKLELPDSVWKAQTLVGRAEQAMGHKDQARRAFVEAISTIEGLRAHLVGGEQAQQQFFEDKVLPYYAMVDLLVDQNEPSEAFIYAERSKGRALLDVLQSGGLHPKSILTRQNRNAIFPSTRIVEQSVARENPPTTRQRL